MFLKFKEKNQFSCYCVFFIASGNSLSEQTKKFLHKLNAISEILENIFTTKDAVVLLKQVHSIIDRVKEEGTLNAGGKFEWVDSVLVKVSCSFFMF